MIRYISWRAGQSLLTLLVLLTFIFVAVRLTGDPTSSLLPEMATAEDRAELRSALHLDLPIWRQYLAYVADMVRGEFGRSYKWDRPVAEMLLDRLPVTGTLALLGGALTLGIGLPLGVIAARYRGQAADYFARGVALIGQSVPIFVLGLLGILLFSVKLAWLPVAGVDKALGYVLPAMTLGWFGVAAMIRVTRVSMLNALGADYIVTARAKGLSRAHIVYRHALPNALIPIVTIFGLILATLLTGAVVTETLFGLPGVGRLAVEAIVTRDFPIVQGVVVFTTSVYIFINFLVDVMYGFLDPRTRQGNR
ncbi:MAG: ABC transporter permease [Burkholderiales bacterium]